MIVNGMSYPLSTMTSGMIKEMLHINNNDIYIDLDNMGLDINAKASILKKIIDLETNWISMIYVNEYISSQKNGQRLYNALFSKINSIIGVYKHKLNTDTDINANEYLIYRFPQLLADINCYVNTQKILQSVTNEKEKRY